MKKDMEPELIPGHTYKYNDDHVYYFIGFNAKAQAVFDYQGTVFVLNDILRHKLREYKEPKRGTVWVNVYERGRHVEVFSFGTKSEADRWTAGRVACMELSWVEGQGL